MDSRGQLRPRARMLAALVNLHENERDGTLFLSTDQNHMATVTLQGGEIVALQYRNKRGERALAPLSRIEQTSYRFDSQFYMFRPQPDLPPTDVILQRLGAVKAVQPQPAAPPSAESRAASPLRLSSERKRIIQTTLAKFVGPLASVACQQVFAQASTLEDALSALAEQMPERSSAEQFLDEVAKALRET